MKIELEEWSGPVSPRFRYYVRARIETEGDALVVHYEEEGANAVASITKPMSSDARATLKEALTGAFELGGDLVADPKRKGVSFNRLVIEDGAKKMELAYTLAALDEPRMKLIQAIKTTARATATSAR